MAAAPEPTSVQIAAAQLLVKRAKARGEDIDRAVKVIAEWDGRERLVTAEPVRTAG